MACVIVMPLPPLTPAELDELVSACVVAVTAMSGWLVKVTRDNKRHIESNTSKLTAIKEQVSNDHTTNLRDDFDTLGDKLDIVMLMMQNTMRDVGGLREEMRTERDTRAQADNEIKTMIGWKNAHS